MSETRDKRATRGKAPARLGDMAVTEETVSDDDPLSVTTEDSDYSPPSRTRTASASPPAQDDSESPESAQEAPEPEPARVPECGFHVPPTKTATPPRTGHKHRSLKLCKRKREPEPTRDESEMTEQSAGPPSPKRVCVEDEPDCGPTAAERAREDRGRAGGGPFIDLTADTATVDPVSLHVARERLSAAVRNENAAADAVLHALYVVTNCVARAGDSVVNGAAGSGVRAVLRSVIDMPKSATSVETRQAARELIALDRKMVETMNRLRESLLVNSHVKDLQYERFLRDYQCPICMEPFANPESGVVEVVRFQCDHAIHTQCMVEWASRIPQGRALECPCCRHVVEQAKHDDEESDDTSDDDMDEDDGAYHGRLPSDPAQLCADRVTRSAARENEREGRNPYAPR